MHAIDELKAAPPTNIPSFTVGNRLEFLPAAKYVVGVLMAECDFDSVPGEPEFATLIYAANYLDDALLEGKTPDAHRLEDMGLRDALWGIECMIRAPLNCDGSETFGVLAVLWDIIDNGMRLYLPQVD